MRFELLDHGYVEFIEAWGRGKAGQEGFPDYEVGIIEAARQSTQGSFRGWEQDSKLLTHLYDNNHDTPFEFAGMIIEVQAPIFVFREWHRHRTQSYNEMSARYTPLPDLCYMPMSTIVQDRAISGWQSKNKQAGGMSENPPDEREISAWLRHQQTLYQAQEVHYQQGLRIGVPKEIARIGMPVGHYSRMRASGNLRNWLGFLTLRMDPKAQWEIQRYAHAVGHCIAENFPQTWKLFTKSRG